MTKRFNFKNIRALLTDGFNYEELARLCYDEPDFRPVNDQLGPKIGKTDLIDRLIDYAYQNSLLDSLLSLLQELNPACYEQRQPFEGEADWDSPEVAAYLAAVEEAFCDLPLEGSDQRIPLTDVFVMLQAAQVRPRRDVVLTKQRRAEMGLLERLGFGSKEDQVKAKAKAKIEPPPPPPVEVSAVLQKYPRLVILGEPGSGKTTLLRFIALCLATNEAEAKLNLTEKYLPVFIELRRLIPSETLEQLLFKDLAAAPYHLPVQTIKDWLNEGRLMLLLDALDEVPLEQQAHMRKQVEDFAASKMWSHNRIILSSRIAGYREGSSLSVDRFAHYTLRPLSGVEDTKLYILGWLRSLGFDEARAEVEAAVKAEQLIDYMTKQPGLRRIMSNPLQLRLAIAAYYEGGRAALINRAQLYRHYLEEALRRREQARGACPAWDKVMTDLERLAWARHTTPSGQLSQRQAIELLDEGGYEQFNFLRQRTGLIVEVGQTEQGEQLLAFSHQTYQEYLIALVLSRAWQKGQKQREAVWRILKPRLHHPDWREPILLLAGLLPSAEASDLLRRIRRTHSSYENVLHRDLLLALDCLANSGKVKAAISGDIIAKAIALWRSREEESLYLLSAVTSLLLTLLIAYFLPWEGLGLTLLRNVILTLGICLALWFIFSWLWSRPPLSWLLPLLSRWVSFGHYPQLKSRIVGSIIEIEDVRIAEAFLAMLEDKELRRAAAEVLGQLGNTRAVPPLIAALSDDKRDIMSQVAARALGQLGDISAVPPLITALGSYYEYVRQAAAEALGQLGDGRAVPPLITVALYKDRHKEFQAVVKALGKLGDAAVEPLVTALNDENEAVRERAAIVLGELGDARAVEPLIAALNDKNEFVRWRAITALGQLEDAHAVEPLIAALGDKNIYVRLRAYVESEVAKALGQLGNNAVVPLIAALRDKDRSVRWTAAKALGQLGDPRAVEPLIATLSDRWNIPIVAWALGQLGDTRAVEPLIAVLEHEDDEGVRWAVVEALRRLGDSHAVEPLITALGSEGWKRERATEILGQLRDTRAVEPLIIALRSTDWHMRQIAAEILGQLRDTRAVEPLITVLRSADYWPVRQAAAEALAQLGDTRAVGPLITALRSADWHLRQAAAKALAQLGDAHAVGPLIATLKDKNWEVRQDAAKALAQLGDTRAVGPLIAILKDEHGDVRWAAATLGQLATKLATEHCRTIAHRLWWEAATPDQPDVYEPLLSIATRLVVLEVERLPAPKYPDF
jgi:HEAT repeat protein